MSVFSSHRPVPLGAITTFRAVSLAERALEAFDAWRNGRATEKALAELSDAELEDIGLHRGAIPTVARQLAGG